ncbi:hypothetical protein LCM20_12670 [Halobacillus litoralis]|uniref:hypothetical protein n=1 Tax=Halobacillus litoralis TaxID=45668 RepID=UPI001CD6ACD0|nr:hypothetical protein [Halobacillus litoralis]MCA0971451.1 hypothetical protein [Halobacillus litoralis]
MRKVFCYYKKSRTLSNGASPIERIVHQDHVLSSFCDSRGYEVMKRFSDIGFKGGPLRRAELIEMRNLVQSPTCKADLMVMYSVFAVRGDTQMNEDLFLENIKAVGEIYFHKQDLYMNYERLYFFLKGPRYIKGSFRERSVNE